MTIETKIAQEVCAKCGTKEASYNPVKDGVCSRCAQMEVHGLKVENSVPAESENKPTEKPKENKESAAVAVAQPSDPLPPEKTATLAKSNSVKLQPNSYLNKDDWNAMSLMAETFYHSGALPADVKNAPQLMMKLQAGYELGMKPIESIKAFYFVNGQLNIWGAAVGKMVRKHGWIIKWLQHTDKVAEVRVFKPVNSKEIPEEYPEDYTEKFTIEDARKAGLTTKKNWTGYAEDMLRYKALARLVKHNIPEVLEGVTDIVEANDNYIPGFPGEVVSTQPMGQNTNLTNGEVINEKIDMETEEEIRFLAIAKGADIQKMEDHYKKPLQDWTMEKAKEVIGILSIRPDSKNPREDLEKNKNENL